MKVLGSTSPTRSSGIDGVPMHAILALKDCVARWLEPVIRSIVEAGEWPEQWKNALVLPIYKGKGQYTSPASYRGISLLPAVSRLVEKCLHVQLQRHLDKYVLPHSQHGFRASHSRLTAIAHLVDILACAREAGMVAMVLTLDLALAFDTVDHDVLLSKARLRAAFSDPAVHLLASFLRGRTQRLRVAKGTSAPLPVRTGVPQGSVLGPALFSLYTADLPDAVGDGTVVQFADDTTIVVTAPDPASSLRRLASAVADAMSYFTRNRIVVNPAKCELLAVGAAERVSVTVDGHQVTSSDTVTVLGFKIDKDLSWVPHAEAVAARGAAVARYTVRALRGLRSRDLAWAVAAFALPIIDGGMMVLAKGARKADRACEKAYHRAARWATGEDSSRLALLQLDWPRWEDRVAAFRARFAMRVWEDGLPHHLRKLLPRRDEVASDRSTRLRERAHVPLPDMRSLVGRRAFRFWGAVEVAKVLAAPPPERERPQKPPPRQPRQPHDKREPDSPRKRCYLGHLQKIYAGRTETTVYDRHVVWTDGSASKGRAGAAVYYGDGNTRNRALPVPGQQTSQRAELAAVLHILETDRRALEIRTDSRYVVMGATVWRHAWRRCAWRWKPSRDIVVANADLWHRIDRLLTYVDRPPVMFTKVKAHAGLPDVAAGLTEELDVWGNTAADWLAKFAADVARHIDIPVPHVCCPE
jgi:ribonuclease HI